MKTGHKMALMAVACAALTAYATSQAMVETGLGRVLAVALAISSLLGTLMFGAAYLKLRKG
jgi:hypothetical protein